MFRVVKKQKRLYIEDSETMKLVYTPPQFISVKIKNSQDLNSLADDLNSGVPQANAITAFETKMAPD